MTRIRHMAYQPPDAARAQVEWMPFDRLRRLNDGGTQRGDFHVLAVVERGCGSVAVDFVEHELRPRTAVLIGPGVVHRWIDITDLTGDVVLFVPTAPMGTARALAAAPATASCWRVPDAAWPLVAAGVRHLERELGPPSPRRDGPDEVANLLLSAVLVRSAPPSRGSTGRYSDVFDRFRAAVEHSFREHHDVVHYARALGYDPRTLSRAAHAATGTSAKDHLDERIVLEAKRLLAHDRLPPGRCADRLGFSDAANFSAFFLRRTGMRPGAWQQAEPIHGSLRRRSGDDRPPEHR